MAQAESYPADETTVPSANPAAAKPVDCRSRRRWFQFSLRSLLTSMLVAGVLLGMGASAYRRAARQAIAVNNLASLSFVTHFDCEVAENESGRLIYQWERSLEWSSASELDRFRASVFHDVVAVDADLAPDRWTHGIFGSMPHEPSPIDKANDREAAFWKTLPEFGELQQLSVSGPVSISRIKVLPSFRRLRVLELKHSELDLESLGLIAKLPAIEVLDLAGNSGFAGTDAMEALAQMPRLKHVGLSETGVTDADLAILVQYSRIEDLDLTGTDITPRGLLALRDLSELRRLSLRGTAADDSWTDELGELTQLESLDISHTRLSGAVMETLAKLPRLRELCTSYTNITGQALNRFQETNPDCRFVWTERWPMYRKVRARRPSLN